MALVQKVNLIVSQAAAIQQLGVFSRPAEYEKLVTGEIVPLLLEVAEFIDNFNIVDDGAEVISVADVLNEFKSTIDEQQRQVKALTEKQAATEKRLTALQKPATKKAVSAEGAA